MVEIETYLDNLLNVLKKKFASRLLYVGLQGSYLRNEADAKSDIDVMVILDNLSIQDLALYKSIIKSNHGDKSCGFICGQDELKNWNPCEINHLLHTTKDYYGALTRFVPPYTKEDERNYLKISLNNLYHAICHSFIHASPAENIETLPQAYKSVFFILQNSYFFQTGDFVPTKQELLAKLTGEDQQVLRKSLELKNQSDYDFEETFQLLFSWCKNKIQEF